VSTSNSGPSCAGLRVLLVGTYPPPYGGIASHLTTLVPGLRARGASDIAVISLGDISATEAHDGFTLYRFNVKQQLRRLLPPRSWRIMLAAWRSLRRHGLPMNAMVRECVKAVLVDGVAERHGSNVVSFYASHSHIELLPLTRVWGRRRPAILTVFGEVYGNAQFMKQYRDLFAEMLHSAHAVVASSKHCAQSFQQLGIDRQVEPVYYGVDTEAEATPELRAAFRAEHGFRADDVVVLFLGRFLREMGLDVLFDALPALVDGEPRLRLVVAGARGELSDDATRLAERYAGRLVVLQDVPFSKLASLYSGADMLVAPSFDQRACMGMSIKEAMAAGLAVVAGAGGGVPEAVVEHETGFLVPVAADGRVDVDEFTQAVLRLSRQPELRRRLGMQGRARAVEFFAHERTNTRMAEIFLDALAASQKQQPN
jgi:glycosyltransferase involved in cell wall biosynthesis